MPPASRTSGSRSTWMAAGCRKPCSQKRHACGTAGTASGRTCTFIARGRQPSPSTKCGQCHLCVVSGRLDGNLGPSPCLCECMKARRSCVCICDAASCHLFLLYIVYTSAVGVFHANQGGPDKNSTLLQVQPVHQVSFCQDLTDFTITVLPRTVCKRNVTF